MHALFRNRENDIFCGNGRQPYLECVYKSDKYTRLPYKPIDGTVKAFAEDSKGNLYIGGWFNHVGDKVSPYLAKINLHYSALKTSRRETFQSNRVQFKQYNSIFKLSGIQLHDQIAVFSIDGRLLAKKNSVSVLNLSYFLNQTIIITVTRSKSIVLKTYAILR